MDTIADMLTRIRNAVRRGQKSTSVPFSKMKKEIANLLVKYGYIEKVEEVEIDSVKKKLNLTLKYEEDGKSVIIDLKRISKPSQRIYSGCEKIQRIGGKRGMILVSTSAGIMPHWEARKKKAGGEVLCVIY